MNILAIGAHPDDIEFGCGGSLIKFARQGNKISLFTFTKGEHGGNTGTREKEQNAVAKKLKAKQYWGNYQDTHIPTDRHAIATLEKILKKVKPNLIFVHWKNDTHQDHRAVADITISATRYIRNVLFYEVPTSIEFDPGVFMDIGDVLKEKMGLLETHASQVFATRIAGLSIRESATSCANFRGFQGRVKYAEGFHPLRLSLLFRGK
ncbi:MAG: PIG-L family deacetylase [Elusimicrobia bacterium]|nr:PIG-L family deacetylase [Elusimicrobiota bacterium]